ncbi:hypothetical protein LCGC14_0543360 [marine sediment metagenome]|uniref:Uncharacterized protein n=1 Tax=marine sediment metagenome TaxID=412755 RepID=A0A0F9RSA1_9ZZZZ|nr:MAG: hypothetical protein Lokiarch_36120 [Candidatus Lokiarchaeum sp. GC14_75]
MVFCNKTFPEIYGENSPTKKNLGFTLNFLKLYLSIMFLKIKNLNWFEV